MTTNVKEIVYDRITRDYLATLDGEVVGYYSSYHAAEVALDALVYELLIQQPPQEVAA